LERNCWYCHKPLPLTKLLKRNLFCSSKHEELYFGEQSAAAFERMKEPDPPPTQPSALEVKPPEIEQPPAENSPPMAAYLKPEVFAHEARQLAIALEDPLDMLSGVAEAAQPLSARWQIKPELVPAGWISESAASPKSDPEAELRLVPFTESRRDPAQMRSRAEPAGVNSLKCAPYIPLWNGRAAAGETAAHVISAEAPPAATLSPRVVASVTHLHAHLNSTAAACSRAMDQPALATPARLELEISSALEGREIQSMVPAAAFHIGARIDPRTRPVPASAHPGTVPCLERQTELPCRIPLADSGKLKGSIIRTGTAPAAVLAGRDDAATQPRVAPLTAIRVQPASIFAAPTSPARLAFGWARRKLAPNGGEFLVQRSSITAPLQPVPQASGGPAQPTVAVTRFPITRIPRSAPCFALDLRLQAMPYHRGGG
jgi:hypothetical protein